MNPHEPHPATATRRPTLAPRWQLTLLGGLRLTDGTATYTRLPSRAITALLARLALWPQRAHAREELVELLWPGVDLATGRNRLRQALSTLKSLLEPPQAVAAPVVHADRLTLRLVAGSLQCDVHVFERHVRAGDAAAASACYGGDLLPGFYDDWIDDERSRLAALRDRLGAAHAALHAVPSLDPPHTALRPAPALPGAGPASRIDRPADGAALAERDRRRWLPHYMTQLFGVEAQSARLQAAVGRHRLVTLLGPGGSGKTRLAVELVHAITAAAGAVPPAEGVSTFEAAHFVSLIGCRDPGALVDALSNAFELPSAPAPVAVAPGPTAPHPVPADGARDPAADATARTLDGIVSRLAGHRRLLVLDNFEQLVDGAVGVVAVLAERLPQLHLLVTSRRPLRLDGERELAIEPLRLPPAGVPLADLARNPAVALFVDRAQAVRSDFHLGPRNAEVLAALVRALDGMPLAIELAAARVRSVAPSEMLARLTAPTLGTTPRLDLLARQAPRGGLDVRHASMHATIDWSWQLLAPATARLLGALTCLPAGATADTSAAMWDGAEDVHALLDELVAHSLVRFEPADAEQGHDAGRFVLFEPIREFAAARLTPAQAALWRGRLRRWAVGWARGVPFGPSIVALRTELPNLCAAFQAATADDPSAAADGVHLLLALKRRFEAVDLPAEALQQGLDAIERCDDPALQGLGFSAIGPLLYSAGRSDAALRCVERGADAAAAGDAPLQAAALLALAKVQWRVARRGQEVERLLDRIDHLLGPPAAVRADPSLLARADVLALRARIAIAGSDFDRARRLQGEALPLFDATGDLRAVNDSRYALACIEQSAGHHAAALAQLANVVDGARAMHDWRRLAQSFNVQGNAFSGLRRWRDAVAAFHASIDLAWRCMSPYELAFGLWNLPRALAHLRRPAAALRLTGFVAAFWEEKFGAFDEADRRDLRRVRRLCARQLDPLAARDAWAHGAALSLAEAVADALSACSEFIEPGVCHEGRVSVTA